MAMSTCVKCGGHNFEAKEVSPTGAKYKQIFIQCSSCGVPVGVTGYYDAGAKLVNLEKASDSAKRSLDDLGYRLSRIEQKLK